MCWLLGRDGILDFYSCFVYLLILEDLVIFEIFKDLVLCIKNICGCGEEFVFFFKLEVFGKKELLKNLIFFWKYLCYFYFKCIDKSGSSINIFIGIRIWLVGMVLCEINFCICGF